MKSKICIALFFSFLGLTVDLQAQTAGVKEKPVPLRTATMQQRLKQSSAPANQYHNKEQEILSRLNTGTIPSDFPVYKPEYSDEQYIALMDKWYSTHTALLKKETSTNQSK